MSPLEFMQRLAALVPRPRLNLIRLVCASLRFAKWAHPRCANHGVLAPTAKLRAQVVPAEPSEDAAARLECETPDAEPDDEHRRGSRIRWAPPLMLARPGGGRGQEDDHGSDDAT
jgi:hypothetical protein